MPSLAAARQANAAFLASLKEPPVAVFVGGTSGIGQATAEAFARHTKGNAHIILCGRNRDAAEKIIASFPSPSSPVAKHEFVECDATLMSNVRSTTAALRARLPKLNFLMLSAGIMTIRGRDDTSEGIDRKLALHYYSRWRFAHDLVPLLRAAREAGEDAKLLTVLSTGSGRTPNVDDFGLKKPGAFSLRAAALAAQGYNDYMIQSFAARNPTVAFTHAYPGGVRTNLFRASDTLSLLNPLVLALTWPITRSPADAGEFMLYALLQGRAGEACGRGDTGEETKITVANEEVREQLWEHTLQETGGI